MVGPPSRALAPLVGYVVTARPAASGVSLLGVVQNMLLGASQRKTMLEETTAHAVVAQLQTEGRSATNLDRVPTGPEPSPDFLVTIDSTPVALEVKRDGVDEPAARAEKGVERLERSSSRTPTRPCRQAECAASSCWTSRLTSSCFKSTAVPSCRPRCRSSRAEHPRGGSQEHPRKGSSADRVYGPLGPAAGRVRGVLPCGSVVLRGHHGPRPDGPPRGRSTGSHG